MKSRRLYTDQIVLLFGALVIVVFMLDTLFGQYSLDLSGDASSFSTIWFSELVSIIVLPIIAATYLKRVTLNLIPLIIAGVVTLSFAVSIVATNYSEYPFSNPISRTYKILNRTVPYQFYPSGEDPQLISPVTPFLAGQLPFVSGFVSGFVLLYGVKKYQHANDA